MHTDPSEAWPALEKLMQERIKKCLALLPKVLSRADPNAVHDFRVWSRRLQQVIVTLLPKPAPPEARTMVRALRRARRSLGAWRDCDVVIALLERKARFARDPEQKQAWELALAWAGRERRRCMRRARSKIANRKVFTLPQQGRELLDRRAQETRPGAVNPLLALASSVGTAYSDWRESLARAQSSTAAPDLHAFRIQTKRLRYRIELMRDLGSTKALSALTSLRTVQEELGRWHDNLALIRIVAEAFGKPELLIQHPLTVAATLRTLDRDNTRYLKRVHQLLTNMHEGLNSSPLQAAIVEFGAAGPLRETNHVEADSSEGAVASVDRGVRMPNCWPVEELSSGEPQRLLARIPS